MPRNFETLNYDLFTCDITNHLNDLNIQLHGKTLIFQLVGTIKVFKMKLKCFLRRKLLKAEMYHFPACVQHIPKRKAVELGAKYTEQIAVLLSEFWQNYCFRRSDASWNWFWIPFLSIQKCPENSNWGWLIFKLPLFTKQSIRKNLHDHLQKCGQEEISEYYVMQWKCFL